MSTTPISDDAGADDEKRERSYGPNGNGSETEGDSVDQKMLLYLGECAALYLHEERGDIARLGMSIKALVMHEDDKGDKTARRRLDRIVQLIERLRERADLFSLLWRGVRGLQPEPIRRVATSIATVYEPIFSRCSADLDVEVAQDVSDIEVPGGDLKLILKNLLDNALSVLSPFMGGRHVRVFFFRRKEEICIEVIDNGPGIPHDLKERIWEAYCSTSRTRAGLGLYIVRKLLDRYGGTATEDGIFGKGASFHLTLPMNWRQLGHEDGP